MIKTYNIQKNNMNKKKLFAQKEFLKLKKKYKIK